MRAITKTSSRKHSSETGGGKTNFPLSQEKRSQTGKIKREKNVDKWRKNTFHHSFFATDLRTKVFSFRVFKRFGSSYTQKSKTSSRGLCYFCVITDNYLITLSVVLYSRYKLAHTFAFECVFDVLFCARKTLVGFSQGFSYFWIYRVIIIRD